MSQLLRQGLIAALAPVGVPTADIVVTDENGQRACAIQVKTRRQLGTDGGWHMKAKHESIKGASLFYVFLSFPTDARALPDTFVVPSAVVAEVLRISHQTWLARPGHKGQPHKDGDMRRLLPDYSHLGLAEAYGPTWLEPYREAWNQLRLETDTPAESPQ
ncbi:MAG: hypothetical protein M0Z28_15870 [Rhodospirillales bacterium]|uniref:hypothetical protein n=1 Tax=Acidiphilium sp. TaxID=527 RepID=UPI00231451A6|nr:hypothetical protein [Acidiphilium sp.]MDA8250631.1 hypothetical protein [Rhodospirillales bacterium]